MVLEKLEAAVDHRRISIRLKCCTRQLEQDYERFCLVIMQVWARGIDKRLENAIADGRFLHVSEISTVRDEIGVHAEAHHDLVREIVCVVHNFPACIEESLENLCAEATLKRDAVWTKDMVRLYIAGETKDQVGI